MQKFGLDPLSKQQGGGLELEIAKEKASALGIAGKRLERSLAGYRRAQVGCDPKALEELLSRISEHLSEFLIQRELVGLPHENLEWVLRTYDIPAQVLARLGLRADE